MGQIICKKKTGKLIRHAMLLHAESLASMYRYAPSFPIPLTILRDRLVCFPLG